MRTAVDAVECESGLQIEKMRTAYIVVVLTLTHNTMQAVVAGQYRHTMLTSDHIHTLVIAPTRPQAQIGIHLQNNEHDSFVMLLSDAALDVTH